MFSNASPTLNHKNYVKLELWAHQKLHIYKMTKHFFWLISDWFNPDSRGRNVVHIDKVVSILMKAFHGIRICVQYPILTGVELTYQLNKILYR